MNSIVLRPWFYRNAEQIRLKFEDDTELDGFIKSIGKELRWSNSKKCWYMPMSKKNMNFLIDKLNKKTVVETALMDKYFIQRRKLNYEFSFYTFFTALLIVSICTALSQEFYWQRDSGTIGNSLISNTIADSFMIFRFPMLTIFWGHFGGIKNWTTVIIYLFINCAIYAFFLERIITPLRPKKALIKDRILVGQLEMDI